MFARASLVALVLASPAWADSGYPAGLFERSPLNDTPAATSPRGHDFPWLSEKPAHKARQRRLPPLSRVALSVAATTLSRYSNVGLADGAPIVRTAADGGRELVMARWGMPAPPQYRGAPVANISQRLRPALARPGSASETAVWSRRRCFANTPTPSHARRPPR
jgi:hypothetical protein